MTFFSFVVDRIANRVIEVDLAFDQLDRIGNRAAELRLNRAFAAVDSPGAELRLRLHAGRWLLLV